MTLAIDEVQVQADAVPPAAAPAAEPGRQGIDPDELQRLLRRRRDRLERLWVD